MEQTMNMMPAIPPNMRPRKWARKRTRFRAGEYSLPVEHCLRQDALGA